MTQLITASFTDQASGQAAAEALKQEGFDNGTVRLVTKLTSPKGKPKSPEAAEEHFIASLTKDDIAKEDAIRFADTVKSGGSFLSVHAPFGTAERAIRTVGAFNPAEQGGHMVGGHENKSAEVAPLSAALGVPVLSNETTPFSKFWQMPLLANDYSFSAKFGWRLLSDSFAPISKQFGWSLLSEKTASLSTKFNWPLLSDNTAPLSKKFNWPLLSNRKFYFTE